MRHAADTSVRHASAEGHFDRKVSRVSHPHKSEAFPLEAGNISDVATTGTEQRRYAMAKQDMVTLMVYQEKVLELEAEKEKVSKLVAMVQELQKAVGVAALHARKARGGPCREYYVARGDEAVVVLDRVGR